MTTLQKTTDNISCGGIFVSHTRTCVITDERRMEREGEGRAGEALKTERWTETQILENREN